MSKAIKVAGITILALSLITPALAADNQPAASTRPQSAPMSSMHPDLDHGATLLKTVLASLVANNTLTASQSDAILKALAEQRKINTPPRDPKPMPMPSHPMPAQNFLHEHQSLILATLNISQKQLQQALQNGQSLSQIAPDKTPALIKALTIALTEDINKQLLAGKITASEQATQLAALPSQITAFVNQTKLRPSPMEGKENPNTPPMMGKDTSLDPNNHKQNGMGMPRSTEKPKPNQTPAKPKK